jgi:hypothetical protein
MSIAWAHAVDPTDAPSASVTKVDPRVHRKRDCRYIIGLMPVVNVWRASGRTEVTYQGDVWAEANEAANPERFCTDKAVILAIDSPLYAFHHL